MLTRRGERAEAWPDVPSGWRRIAGAAGSLNRVAPRRRACPTRSGCRGYPSRRLAGTARFAEMVSLVTSP